MSDWTIGQEVFAAFTRHGRKAPGVEDLRGQRISKIGRRWITAGEGHESVRFDRETRNIDGKGFSSPGSVWVSADEYLAHLDREALWSELHQVLRNTWRIPSQLSAADIRAFIAKLTPPPGEETRG